MWRDAALRDPPPPPSGMQVQQDKLQHLGYLGVGAFGFVSLEQHKESKDWYALKALSKGHLIKTNMVAQELPAWGPEGVSRRWLTKISCFLSEVFYFVLYVLR